MIFGPQDTPFEDGTFKLTISKSAAGGDVVALLRHDLFSFSAGFTEEYPNKPPTVRFVSKMFHPNVYADGGKPDHPRFNFEVLLCQTMSPFDFQGSAWTSCKTDGVQRTTCPPF